MLRPGSPQDSFYGSYLYDRMIPVDHLLRKINQVVDFSFIHKLGSTVPPVLAAPPIWLGRVYWLRTT